ncbi:MAG: phosphate/phosphite/phosphonate ABC transporter substrate-binding protein [Candidatus Eisenbacteria bacterium]
MQRRTELILGAVAYDPKVVTIWEGFQRYFDERSLPFDFVLFTRYERQVESHLAGQIDVAWNSPLAWIETERLAARAGRKARAIAMRDTDRDLTSVIVVREDSPIRTVEELRGRRVAVGAADSPQGRLIPLGFLARFGLEPGEDLSVVPHDLLVGKHGDHVGGEREAVRALLAGRADAACLLDANLLQFAQEGTLPAGSRRVLAQTPPYDHCNFTALDVAGPEKEELLTRFREELLAMSYDDARVRPLMDLEGLKRWLPARTEGYEQLNRAVDRFGTIEAWLASASGAAGVPSPGDEVRA